MRWEWRKGQATSVADFGDPVHETEYALCLYAGTTASAVAELLVPPSPSRWGAARRGFNDADAAAASAGVRKISLQASSRDRARAALRARGAELPPLDIANGLPTPVVVQLVNSDTGACLESVFGTDDVVQSEPGTFEAHARTSQ